MDAEDLFADFLANCIHIEEPLRSHPARAKAEPVPRTEPELAKPAEQHEGAGCSEDQSQLVLEIQSTSCLYKVVGVSAAAGQQLSDIDIAEIKRAYKRRALKIHPDKSTHPEAEAAFQKLSAAMAVLGDAQERKIYDLGGGASASGGGHGPHYHTPADYHAHATNSSCRPPPQTQRARRYDTFQFREDMGFSSEARTRHTSSNSHADGAGKESYETMTIKELKMRLAVLGVSTIGCTEKADLVHKLTTLSARPDEREAGGYNVFSAPRGDETAQERVDNVLRFMRSTSQSHPTGRSKSNSPDKN